MANFLLSNEQKEYLRETDRMLGIPEGVSESQIYQESQFNPKAKSKAGAVGLGQFIPATAAEFSRRQGRTLDRENPSDSLLMHRLLMKENMETFNGDVVKALRAYNAGPKYTPRWESKENKEYVPNIEKYLGRVYDKNIKGDSLGTKQYDNIPSTRSGFSSSLGVLPTADKQPESITQYNDNMSKLRKALGKKDSDVQIPLQPTLKQQYEIDMNAVTPKEMYDYVIDFEKMGDAPIDLFGEVPRQSEVAPPPVADTEKIKSAMFNMSRQPANTDYIGKDRTGTAMMLDLMADISGYNTPKLLGNKAFTGMNPDERLAQMDEREVGQANLFAKTNAGRKGQVEDLIGDQYKDQALARALTGDTITSTTELLKLLSQKRQDPALDTLRALKGSGTLTDEQTEQLQRLQGDVLRRQGL